MTCGQWVGRRLLLGVTVTTHMVVLGRVVFLFSTGLFIPATSGSPHAQHAWRVPCAGWHTSARSPSMPCQMEPETQFPWELKLTGQLGRGRDCL